MAPGRRTHGARCVVRRGYDAAMMATHGYHRSVSPRTPIAAASTKTRCRAPVLNSQSPVPATLAACLPRFVSIRFFIHVHGILGTCAAFSLLLLLTTRFLLRKALQLHRAFRNAFHFAQRALADPWVLGVNIRRSAISLTLLVIPFSISLPLPLPPSPPHHHPPDVTTYAMVEPVEPVISPFAPAVSSEIRAVLLLLSLSLRPSCILCAPHRIMHHLVSLLEMYIPMIRIYRSPRCTYNLTMYLP